MLNFWGVNRIQIRPERCTKKLPALIDGKRGFNLMRGRGSFSVQAAFQAEWQNGQRFLFLQFEMLERESVAEYLG